MDQRTNKLSTINHIEDLKSNVFPTAIPKFCVVINISKNDGDADESVPILRINNGSHLLVEAPVHVSFVGTRKSRILAQFEGFPLPTPAPIEVTLSHNNEVITSHIIDVGAALIDYATREQPVQNVNNREANADIAREMPRRRARRRREQ